MKPLEWLGVQLLDAAAWFYSAGRSAERLAGACIVRARPIPRPAPLPRIEMPSYVPRIGDVDDERTLTATKTERPVNVAWGGCA